MTLFSDELLLRPIFDDDAQETSNDLSKLCNLSKTITVKICFPRDFITSNIKSGGEPDGLFGH